MIKTYISINHVHLTTNIVVKELPTVIEFKGGSIYPKRRNGVFSTDDNYIQKAIESDNSYNIEFKLIEYDNNTKIAEIAVKGNTSITDVPCVKNKQMAIEWLSTNLNIKTHPSMTYDQIKNVAYERGITFSSINHKLNTK